MCDENESRCDCRTTAQPAQRKSIKSNRRHRKNMHILAQSTLLFVDLSMTYSHLSSSHSSSLYQIYIFSSSRLESKKISPSSSSCNFAMMHKLSSFVTPTVRADFRYRWWFPPTIRYVRPMVKGNSSSQLPLDGICQF